MSPRDSNVSERSAAAGLSPNVRGALWMVGSAIAFSLMGALIKILGQELHGFQIAFFRALFGLIAVLPLMFGQGGIAILRTAHWKLHAFRVVVGTAAMLCIFYAITQMELATATAIAYARPLFLVVLAVLFLGEAVRWRRWAATVVGFLGVLLILRPGAEAVQPAALVALAAAFFMAVAMVCIKKLSGTDRPLAVLVWFAVGTVVTSFLPALWVWQTPTWEMLGLAALMGGLGSLGQYAVIRAFRVGEATAVVPFDYSQIPFAWAWGFLLFAEQPSMWTWVGAAIIVASNIYIVHREARLRRTSPPLPPSS